MPKESLGSHAAGMDLTYEYLIADTVWTGDYQVNISTGNFGPECSWNITDNNTGAIIASGSGYNSFSNYNINICVPPGNYSFNWFDSWGDGWNGGSYSVINNTGTILTSGAPNTGSSGSTVFASTGSSCFFNINTYPPNTYRLTLKFYRDCSNGINAPSSFTLNYSSSSCGYSNSEIMSQVSTQNITPVCASISNPCGPTIVGIEEYVYQTTLTLPSSCNDWILSACLNARNAAITTINNPGAQDLCVVAELNNTNNYQNSSPVFNEFPTPYICVNQQFCYNNGAVDIDGDSLVYSLVTPLNTANGGTVNYFGGFSAINPITGTTTFNPNTGDLCILATQIEVSVVAMKVSEFRNGVLIGSVLRDIQVIVLNNCATNPPVLTGLNGSPINVTTAATADITVDHCSNGIDSIIRTISATLGNSTNKVMSWSGVNPATSNPATFSIANNGTTNPTGTFSWVPDYIDVLNSPFLFTVNVTDDACPINNSFSFTYTINLSSSSGFSVQGEVTDVTCPSLLDGEIDITVIGINGSPTFSWTGPNGFSSSSEDITGLDIGNYTLEITAPDGCVTAYNYDVLSNSVFVSETHIDLLCFGDGDGSIDLFVSGGVLPYSYSWVDASGNFISNQEDLANLSGGTYTVTVTDDLACSAVLGIAITEPSELMVNGSISSDYNGKDISCFGQSDGEITASAFGGSPPYLYSLDNIVFTSNSVFTNLSQGLQTIFYKDLKGCLNNEDIILTEPSSLNLAIDSFSNISCFGYGDGHIYITVTGGTPFLSPSNPYTYSWSNFSSGFTSSLEDLDPVTQGGTYYGIVTDLNSCFVNSPPVNIFEPIEITGSFNGLDLSCFGSNDGIISLAINGGTAPYTVDWTGPTIIPQQNSTPYYLDQLQAGSYSFTITDSEGCVEASNPIINLVEPADIVLSIVNTPVTCYEGSDGSLDLTVSNISNPSFVWTSDDPNFYETTEDISSLPQGIYSVLVTDGITGCTKSLTEVTQIITPYNVTTSLTNESCFNQNDGSINITPNSSATYTYNWVYPNTSTSTAQNVSNASPGNYQLDISYTQIVSSGTPIVCTVPYSFFVMPASELTASVSSSLVSCEGGNDGSIGLSLSGGTPFPNNSYSYLWSNTETTKDISSLSVGLYSVTALDQNGCSWDTSITLSSLVFDTAGVSIVPVLCKGESTASVDILGIIGGIYPYTFLWTSPTNAFVSTNEDVLNIPAGSYWLDISDASGCTITRSISVSEPSSALSVFVSNIDSSTCYGYADGSIEIQISGGISPYVSNWGNANPDSLLSGMYTYEITDANGCNLTDSVFVAEPEPILITPSVTPVACPGDSSGAISILLTGPVSSSSFVSWTGPIMNNNQPYSGSGLFIDNLLVGNYTCIVTNGNGCASQLEVFVTEPYKEPGIPNPFFSTYAGGSISCKGGSDGWIKIEMTGGDYNLDNYTFIWDNGDISDSIFDLSAGSYTVTITDPINCTQDWTYILYEPNSVVGFNYNLSDTNGYNISCYGRNDAHIKINAFGGVSNYSYKWFKNDTLEPTLIQDSIYNLEAANYYVIVSDQNDCSVADTITIIQPDSVYFILNTATDTCSLNKGYAEVSPFGGVMGYQYLWSTGNVLDYVDTLSEGRYNVLVQDANLCQSSQFFDITNLPSPIADFTLNPAYKKLSEQLKDPFVFIDRSETFTQSIDLWTWELIDSIDLIAVLTDSIADYSFDKAGVYTVLLTIQTEFNCLDTISKNLKVEDYTLWIPNAFSPTSDIILNKEFKPEGEGVKEFVMKIYSRWGSLVYETNDFQKGWNGINDNNEIITGVYTYYVEVLNVFGEVHKYEGVFNLIR